MNTGLSTKTLFWAYVYARQKFVIISRILDEKDIPSGRIFDKKAYAYKNRKGRQANKFLEAILPKLEELEQIKQRYEAQGEGKK